MKRLLTLLILVLSSAITKANEEDSIRTFLFPQFETGIVVLKSNGARLSAQFNYDMVDERMLYIEADNTINELDASAVTSITIGEHTFIPSKNKAFYEIIKTGDKEYYVSHKSKILSQGKSAGYGSYSQTASIGGLAITNSSGSLYLLGASEKFKGVDETVIFIKNGKKYEKITSLKTLVKHFKSHQAHIESYAKDNKINFSKVENVTSIVEFALSL